MIRSLRVLSAVGLCVFALASSAQTLAPIPPLTSPVVDATGTLNAAEIAQLERQALALQQRKGSQLQILIVPTTRPEAIEQYAQRAFDDWKLGRKGVDDGVLLLVAKDDREVRIQPGYGLEGAIPDIAAGRIVQEYLVPKFRNGDFAGGIGDASAQLVRLIDGEALPEPMAPQVDGGGGQSDWFGAMFVAFFASVFARGLFGAVPRPMRALLVGAAAGIVVWLFAAPWLVIVFAALIGALIGASTSSGRHAGHGGWGNYSGGSSGGGWSGSGGGSSGWSGGGGRSGGGGASGRW